MMINTKFKKSFRRLASLVTAAFLALPLGASALSVLETPEAEYQGMDNAPAVIRGIDFTDIRNSNTWAREAIYASSALGVMNTYGNTQFNRTAAVSKEEALAIAYRMAGREAEAQMAGETLNNARAAGQKKTSARSIWYDGYLQLAVKDGLISNQNYLDAMQQDQTTLQAGSFRRSAAAQRQEIAFWIAKALKMEPVYGQQKVLNSYRDWTRADADKIPYIEAVVKNRIMNGDSNGNFNPASGVTRQEAAQIVRNTESVFLPQMGLEKKTGTIEKIVSYSENTNGQNVTKKTFQIRNSTGTLHTIQTAHPDSPSNLNEVGGKPAADEGKELVTYSGGTLGNSSRLKEGDRLEYLVAADGTVQYVRVISNDQEVSYIGVQVVGVDTAKRELRVDRYMVLNYPDLEAAAAGAAFNMSGTPAAAVYTYSSGAPVVISGRNSDMGSLSPDSLVILTVRNRDQMVIAARTADFAAGIENQGIVKGIVEDNNPELGYITLYFEDGTGSSPEAYTQLLARRTYHYAGGSGLEVYRNKHKAEMEEVQAGDTVFMKVDRELGVTAVSAVSNYTMEYGTVVSKKAGTLYVRYENGTTQRLDVDSTIPVIVEKNLATLEDVRDGDRVRLMLHKTDRFTRVKEITVESGQHRITSIYKATVSYIDGISDKVVASNLQAFQGGDWNYTGTKGVSSLRLADECRIMSGSVQLERKDVNRLLRSNEAYMAVEQDYGGEERVVLLSFRNEKDAEDMPYDDSITNAIAGSGEFRVSSRSNSIRYTDGTIVVKNGRLVTGSSIAVEDLAYVVANRSQSSGEYYAGVVMIDQQKPASGLEIYRGRIGSIQDSRDITVNSFARLNGQLWEYANTPKTFTLSADTRITDSDGVVSLRDFITYGTGSYKDKVVYVVADGTKALYISTAPYGEYMARGTLYQVTGGTIGDEGTVTEEPTGLKLRNSSVYDPIQHLWVEKPEISLNLLNDSLILKEGKTIKPSELKTGNTIRALKLDSAASGDAYILWVEEAR